MPDPTALPENYKGIACTHCGTIPKFKTGQLKKSKDCLTRPKICPCGAVTITVEVPISMTPPPGQEAAPVVGQPVAVTQPVTAVTQPVAQAPAVAVVAQPIVQPVNPALAAVLKGPATLPA